MARQGRCKACHIRYVWWKKGEIRLDKMNCPNCGKPLERTTLLTKDRVIELT